MYIGHPGQTHPMVEQELGRLPGAVYHGALEDGRFKWLGMWDKPPVGHEEVVQALRDSMSKYGLGDFQYDAPSPAQGQWDFTE